MSIIDIVKYGDPRLRKVAKKVVDFDRLPSIIKKLYDSMYEAEGIGLAANQIGIDAQLFIIDITHSDEAEETAEFVNAEIVEFNGEITFAEGCLSVPGIEFDIARPEIITLKFQQLDGTELIKEFGGLYARAIQHEIDHLKGKLIVDHVSSIAKLRYKSQIKEIKELAMADYSQIFI